MYRMDGSDEEEEEKEVEEEEEILTPWVQYMAVTCVSVSGCGWTVIVGWTCKRKTGSRIGKANPTEETDSIGRSAESFFSTKI